MADETSEYPLSTANLDKGSKVTSEEIERAFCVQVGTSHYQLAMLQACDYVRRKLLERGLFVTVKQRHNDLVVLTDTEASAYNQQRFNAELRGAFRAHARQLGVDRSKLDDKALDKHDRSLEIQGRTLSAIRKSRREVPTLRPNDRLTPGGRDED
jgi:hypothetical protein